MQLRISKSNQFWDELVFWGGFKQVCAENSRSGEGDLHKWADFERCPEYPIYIWCIQQLIQLALSAKQAGAKSVGAYKRGQGGMRGGMTTSFAPSMPSFTTTTPSSSSSSSSSSSMRHHHNRSGWASCWIVSERYKNRESYFCTVITV